MENRLWRLDEDNLAGYTECKATMAKVKRSYHYEIMARYYREGKLIALQYRIPSGRKRSARNLFGNVVR